MQKSTIGILAVAALVVALGAGLVIFSGPSQNSGESVPVEKLLAGARHTKGSPAAPVVIVEFGDFECPSCGVAYPEVEKVLRDFGSQVYFVYRHFPLAQHEFGRPAAQAAEAAALQGKFWEMYDQLYQHQNKLDEASVRGYAETLGLDMNRFEQDRRSAAAVNNVNDDAAAAGGFGVTATPTFFINGRRFVGVVSYNQFQTEIQKILSAGTK